MSKDGWAGDAYEPERLSYGQKLADASVKLDSVLFALDNIAATLESIEDGALSGLDAVKAQFDELKALLAERDA